MTGELVTLTKKDFETPQDVRWCPGCGDYAILAVLQKLLPTLGVSREKHVFVSGIGCSSRFPYYMNTFGFHTIHGRAPAIATGVKLANPELTVWVITGDGDALSIGGNHFMHLMRRNVNLNVLLFNNRIYGLTKGQYSPTSEVGKVTKSTPFGSLDQPVDPAALALAAGGTFVARALAVDAKGLTQVLQEAAAHQGTSFIEIYQNCNVFNDGAFDSFGERAVRDTHQVQLEDGKPLRFGKDLENGIALGADFSPRIVKGEQIEQATHFSRNNRQLAQLIASLPFPEFPVPMGVLYQENRPSYDQAVWDQVASVKSDSPKRSVQSILESGDTWVVE